MLFCSWLPHEITKSNESLIDIQGNLTKVEIKSLTREEIEKEITIIRVRGNLEVTCAQNETEISNAFKHLIEKVSCPYGTFQLENSDVFFIHTFVPKPKSNTGWVAGEQFEEEESVVRVAEVAHWGANMGGQDGQGNMELGGVGNVTT